VPKPTKTLWFYKKAPQITLKGDPETIKFWLDITNLPDRRYHLHSWSTGSWSGHVKAKTVERALKNGHLDVECWVYVNQLKRYAIPRNGKNGPTYETRWGSLEAPKNWAMDMDDVPGIIGKTPQDRIDCLLKKFTQHKCPHPTMIVETSKCCFHVVYLGGPTREWTLERRYATALRAAGCSRKVRTKQERDEALKAGGVDPDYLRQNIESAKIRMPGSVNVQKSSGSLDNPGTGTVIAYGWYNHNYQLPTVAILAELDTVVAPRRATRESKAPKSFPDSAWKRFVPHIRNVLAPLVKPDLLKSLTEYLSKNFNMLQRGECRILQTHMAEALGLEQWAVSRLIKNLKEWQILVQTRDYIQKKRAKSYGSGTVLKVAFEEALLAGTKYDIDKPYEAGTTNSHFMGDLRHLAKLSTPVEIVVQIIVQKFEHKPAIKRRSVKEIERAYDLWLNRPQHLDVDKAG